MRPDIEQSLIIDFEELFALKDRLGQVADSARARLVAAGLKESFEVDLFGDQLELRGTQRADLRVVLDSFHLEITGAPPELQTHLVAGILLDEAGAFRLTSVEMGLSLTVKLGRERRLDLVNQAFQPIGSGGGQMLDRRFSMTWDWGDATTGYSFHAEDIEDRELYLGLKAREGYMTLPELQNGVWMMQQAKRFDTMVERFFQQLGWN